MSREGSQWPMCNRDVCLFARFIVGCGKMPRNALGCPSGLSFIREELGYLWIPSPPGGFRIQHKNLEARCTMTMKLCFIAALQIRTQRL